MARMASAVQEALKAGALGFSSSRASTHVTPDDTPVASRIAEWEEIDRILAAMAELDAGIFQVGPDIGSGAAASRLPRPAAAGGARQQAADHVRRARDPAGRGSDALELSDQIHRRHRRRRRPHVRPGHDALDQRDLLAQVLFAVRRAPGLAADPRLADGRAEEAPARSRGAPRAGRGRSGDEAARQDLSGRRGGDHRSAQAGLRQPVRHEGRRLGRPDGRAAGAKPRPASGRGHDRPVARRRQPGLCPAAGQRIARGRARHPAPSSARSRRSRIRARMSARRWARRCRRIS